MKSFNPSTGELLGEIQYTSAVEYNEIVLEALTSFEQLRVMPAPQRGLWIREMADELRARKAELATLISQECGKIISEAEGEVQEMIDMADFAVGLSRQLYGLTMHSERPGHRMYEQWHPIGPIGVITAFNFPMAVWAWNAFVGVACGNPVIWKPSEKTPLCAEAVQKIVDDVTSRMELPRICFLVQGYADIGQVMTEDPKLPLISATGSCRMGKAVGVAVQQRMGRSLLELGGNNAAIIMDDADISMAVRASVFSAVGTTGQRCTSLRRVYVHRQVADEFIDRMTHAYEQLAGRIGDPLDRDVLVGPLIDSDAVELYTNAIKAAKSQNGVVLVGGNTIFGDGHFVEPTIIEGSHEMDILHEETFAPILYVVTIDNLDEAIAMVNDSAQGLSSTIFTSSIQNAEKFLSAAGSDCGIANVNIGTTGAEIGGAFGGEKETGGGREAGSDAWKQYMRRQTCTINYTSELPLAQGVEFDI